MNYLRKTIVVIILIGNMMLFSCMNSAEFNEVKKIAEHFIELKKGKEYEKALELYSTDYLEKVGFEQEIEALKFQEDLFGNLQSYRLKKWDKRVVNEPKKMVIYFFEYYSKHTKYDSLTYINLVKENDYFFRIVEHYKKKVEK